MESFFGIAGAVGILVLLISEGVFLYFVVFRRGRHTSVKKSGYAGTKKCPICGDTIQLISQMPCCGNPKCVNYYPYSR
jgi:hypothetical protein